MQVEGVGSASNTAGDGDFDGLITLESIDTACGKEGRRIGSAAEDLKEDRDGGVGERDVVNEESSSVLYQQILGYILERKRKKKLTKSRLRVKLMSASPAA